MKKTLIIILIIMLGYLAVISIFTNRKTICEPMIDLSSQSNQYISWINTNKEEFTPIKYSQILSDANTEPNWQLITKLFQALGSTPFKDLVGQEEITKAVGSASKSTHYQFSREPVFLIKAPQALLLTHNKTITAVPISTSIEGSDKKNIVLIPHESKFNVGEKKLEDVKKISNKILNLDKVLLLDSDNTKNPTIYSNYTTCNLIKLHEYEMGQDKIPIYILADSNFSADKDLQVSIY